MKKVMILVAVIAFSLSLSGFGVQSVIQVKKPTQIVVNDDDPKMEKASSQTNDEANTSSDKKSDSKCCSKPCDKQSDSKCCPQKPCDKRK